MIATVDLPQAYSVAELMTPAEWTQFHDVDAWDEHGADAAVVRGAAFLDRVIPGWEREVEIKSLDLGDTCRCVLGQVFASMAAGSEGHIDRVPYVSGFTAAREQMGFSMLAVDHGDSVWTPEEFFGFDHFGSVSYNELTAAWRALLHGRGL